MVVQEPRRLKLIGAAVQLLNASAEATALDIEASGRHLKTEGELDLRGTLGIAELAINVDSKII